jgi:hypothetical protein
LFWGGILFDIFYNYFSLIFYQKSRKNTNKKSPFRGIFYFTDNYAPVEVVVVASVPVEVVPVASIIVAPVVTVASVETVSTEPVASVVVPVEVVDFIPGIVHAERTETRTRERARAFIGRKIKKINNQGYFI